MPIRYVVDLESRMLSADAEGDISFREAADFLDAISAQLGFRKLFDSREATSSMAPDEVLELVWQIRSFHDKGPIGPLAMLVTQDQANRFTPLLGALAAAERRMKLFRSRQKAKDWLMLQQAY
ncbi:hypothetical protein [Reyranella sp.]|uniref:hypothetical protein n=1 Tax=Reyranella sp. TaxID=1929291 RepID=UPI003BADAAAD